MIQFLHAQHQQLVVEEEVSEHQAPRKPVKLVDQVVVVDPGTKLLVESVEQEIHPLKVHLQHPFKDMLAEVEPPTV